MTVFGGRFFFPSPLVTEKWKKLLCHHFHSNLNNYRSHQLIWKHMHPAILAPPLFTFFLASWFNIRTRFILCLYHGSRKLLTSVHNPLSSLSISHMHNPYTLCKNGITQEQWCWCQCALSGSLPEAINSTLHSSIV